MGPIRNLAPRHESQASSPGTSHCSCCSCAGLKNISPPKQPQGGGLDQYGVPQIKGIFVPYTFALGQFISPVLVLLAYFTQLRASEILYILPLCSEHQLLGSCQSGFNFPSPGYFASHLLNTPCGSCSNFPTAGISVPSWQCSSLDGS